MIHPEGTIGIMEVALEVAHAEVEEEVVEMVVGGVEVAGDVVVEEVVEVEAALAGEAIWDLEETSTRTL